MVSDLVDAVPLLGVRVQDAPDDVFALAREKLGKSVLSSHDFLVKVRSLRILEGQVTADHSVEYHTAAPDISFETVVPLACDHLWRCVAR